MRIVRHVKARPSRGGAVDVEVKLGKNASTFAYNPQEEEVVISRPPVSVVLTCKELERLTNLVLRVEETK